jgi:hypothetical protein
MFHANDYSCWYLWNIVFCDCRPPALLGFLKVVTLRFLLLVKCCGALAKGTWNGQCMCNAWQRWVMWAAQKFSSRAWAMRPCKRHGRRWENNMKLISKWYSVQLRTGFKWLRTESNGKLLEREHIDSTKVWIFLTSRTTISFSRMTPLHLAVCLLSCSLCRLPRFKSNKIFRNEAALCKLISYLAFYVAD